MTINADQLLNRPSKLHRRYGGRLAMQKAQQEKMVGGASVNIVLTKKSIKGIESIKINVIKIENILKGSLALDKKQLDDKKKATSKKRKEDIETKLETKPNAESGKVKMPSAPRMGILDFIKNFIGNVLLGYFAVRLIKHLPKIMPIVKFLGNAADFIIDVGGKLLNGLVTFIDIGYKAYDATRGFIKNIGGENFAKGFDKFLGAIDTALFLTTVLAGSMAMEAMSGGGGGGPGGGRPGRGGRYGLTETRDARRGVSRVDTTGGMNYRNDRTTGGTYKSGGRLADVRIEKLKKAGKLTFDGKSTTDMGFQQRKGYNDVIKKYADRFGRDAALKRFGQESVEGLGGKYARSGATNLARKGLVSLAGKAGAKAVLGFAKPFLKRLPIIGALIDFGLSVALGEDPGRAAFKAIGAGLLGFIGGAIGAVGGPLSIAGAILGGFAGDWVGGALYDLFFGGKKPQQKNQKVEKKAGGGVTRGGRSQGRARRTISKGKYKRVLAPQKPLKTQFKNKEVKKNTEELDKTKYFGPILAVSSKIMNKEEPTDRDYQNVGLGINLLITKGIQDKQLKGGIVAAFANGGLVDPDVLSAAETGGDISNWVAKTFRGEIESNAEKTLRMIREKKEEGVKKPSTTPTPDEFEIGPAGTSGDKLTMARNLMRDLGLTADQAAGIVGNMAAESGVENARVQNSPPGTKGVLKVDGKTGYGIVQWTSMGRQQSLADYAKSKGADLSKPLSMDIEYQFFLKEFKGEYGHVLSQIKQARDVKTASTIFMQQYEVPAGHKTEAKIMERYNMSKPIYDKLAAGQGIATAGPGTYIDSPTNLGADNVSSVDQFTPIAKEYGLQLTSAYRPGDRGYHGSNRARDYQTVGAPGNSGTSGQMKLAQRLLKDYGSSLKQLIYTPLGFGIANGKKVGLDYWGESTNSIHYDHVHVALAKGGRIHKPIIALIGEKGPEFVFDADTTRGLDKLAPQLLEKLNFASTKPQLASILQSYASYDTMSPQTIVVQSPSAASGSRNKNSSGGGVTVIPIPVDNFTEILAMIG